MAFWKRALIFFAIFLAGLWLGWEYAIAGLIFSLALKPRRYEYLLLGLIFDSLFLFPRGFFTVLITLLIFSAAALERSLEHGKFSSFLARLAVLLLLSLLIFFASTLYALWPNMFRTLALVSFYFIKSFGAFVILLVLYHTLGYGFTGKNYTKELRIFGAR